MSLIKSIKQQLGLGPASENHHWDGSVPNQLTLKRGTPDAPGAELIKALNGVLSFPNQGQALAANGYVKLPGGLIVQWGTGATGAGGGVAVTFSIPFQNAVLYESAQFTSTVSNQKVFTTVINPMSVENMTVTMINDAGVAYNGTFNWIAIGY